MAVAYSGVASSAIEALRTLLKSVDSWQTWTGEATAAATDGHHYEYTIPWEESADKNASRPLAVIDFEPGGHPHEVVPESGIFGGRIRLRFESPFNANHTEEEAARDFNNKIYAVLAEMIDDAAADTTGTKLNMIRFPEGIDGPYRLPEDQREADGDHLWANMIVEYGPEGLAG